MFSKLFSRKCTVIFALFWRWQWRSQTKILGGKKIGEDKMFDFKRTTLFCLGYRLSKHKITIHAKNLRGGHGPLATPVEGGTCF